MELLSLVLEQKFATTGVELKIVNLGVMVDRCLDLIVSEILDADGHLIKKVCDDLGWFTSILEVLL